MIALREIACQNHVCQKPFLTYISEIRRGGGKYCCHRCSIVARTRHPEERFWEYVNRSDNPNTCWLWAGKLSTSGYGSFNVSKKLRVAAHRYSYELVYGPIPQGLYICHTCDVHACINPAHLFAGTQKENLQDALHKGRIPVGEARANTKLTTEQVYAIRALQDTESPTTVARKFGVTRMCVSHIWNRKSWQHLPECL